MEYPNFLIVTAIITGVVNLASLIGLFCAFAYGYGQFRQGFLNLQENTDELKRDLKDVYGVLNKTWASRMNALENRVSVVEERCRGNHKTDGP